MHTKLYQIGRLSEAALLVTPCIPTMCIEQTTPAAWDSDACHVSLLSWITITRVNNA